MPRGSSSASTIDASSSSSVSSAAVYRNYKPKLVDLNDNYDSWIQSVRNVLFTLDCLNLYEASMQPDTTIPDSELDPSLRRVTWGLITQSLSPTMSQKIRDVELGQVETLRILRRIRNEFYRSTIVSKSRLKDQLHSIQLESYNDLSSYIAALKSIVDKLKGLGYQVDNEDMLYYLLKGLPLDYSPVVQVIKIPRQSPLTWDEVVYMLKDFADDPKIIVDTVQNQRWNTVVVLLKRHSSFVKSN